MSVTDVGAEERTTYKYTIEATGKVDALDPDLDVTDPPGDPAIEVRR